MDINTVFIFALGALKKAGVALEEIANLPDPLVPRGTLGTGTGDLPDLPSNPNIGDTYFVATAGTYGGVSARVGDMFFYNNNSTWSYIPTGDVDTWRNVFVNGTEVQGINNKDALKFVNGDMTTVSYDSTNKTIAINSTFFKLPSQTLIAGQTTVTFTDERITANSLIIVYSDLWYTSATQTTGSVTITFPAQSTDMLLPIMVAN